VTAVTYRDYEPGDWPRVRGLLDANDEDAGHAVRVLEHDDARAWVAESGDALVGWVLTRPVVTDEGYRLGGIDDLVVDEAWRGQGIGRRLMELAEAHFRAEGLAALQLTVRADNQVALNLYRSLGFSIKEARLRMRKSLGPDPRTMQ
jgi:ribosomal protein S18 acetylase RimI-like enzyme